MTELTGPGDTEMTELTGPGEIIKGFKATDENMQCRGFQFELGKWYEHEGPIRMCSEGFHFCEYPSGPWAYYSCGRVFKVEAELVLRSTGPGADVKHVAKRIRLIEEIIVDGNENTGHRNTGHRNTGHRNTGHRNTGDENTGDENTGDENTGDENTGDGNTGDRNTGYRNTGDGNTGDGNTGHGNTGDRNTGHRNTGDGNTGGWNTGHRNTGHRNAGHRNTGHWNTGDRNTGDGNTGDGNCCDYSTGFFNSKEQPVYLFNKKCTVPRGELDGDLIYRLSKALSTDEPFDAAEFLALPNATERKIKALHKKHIAARKEIQK